MDRRYPHPATREGLGDSISELAADAAQLVRLEIELFKQEMLALVKRNAIALGLLVGAGVALFLGIIFLQILVIELVPFHAIMAAIFTVLWILLAVTAALVGKARLKFAAPEATIQTIKDDLEWVKTQIKPAPR